MPVPTCISLRMKMHFRLSGEKATIEARQSFQASSRVTYSNIPFRTHHDHLAVKAYCRRL